MPDAKHSLPESILALFAGRDRAAAIMGDLAEMAETRGRLWFVTAYVRTLVSLGWRTPVAFLIGMASMRFLFRTLILLLLIHRTGHLRDASLGDELSTHTRIVFYNCLINAARFLIFALPFVAVRFGLRNRLTQLTCALLLIAVPVYSLRPWVMDLSGILMVTAIVSALIVPQWRRPMIVLAATCATAMAAIVTCVFILVGIFHQKIVTVSASKMSSYEALVFALAAIVCVYMHQWLLQRRPETDRNFA